LEYWSKRGGNGGIMEYWNNGKPDPPGNVICSSRLKEMSLTGITEQEYGVMEYRSIGVLVILSNPPQPPFAKGGLSGGFSSMLSAPCSLLFS